MYFNIKQWMAKVTDQLNVVPQIKTWSGIATPKSQYYNCTTFTLKPKSKYLILANNGNGQGGNVKCMCAFDITSGTATRWLGGASLNDAGSGNNANGWAYVETGSSSCTLAVRGYGYNTSVTNLNGVAIAFRLTGGVLLKSIFETFRSHLLYSEEVAA